MTKRTNPQNNALHKWCRQSAEILAASDLEYSHIVTILAEKGVPTQWDEDSFGPHYTLFTAMTVQVMPKQTNTTRYTRHFAACLVVKGWYCRLGLQDMGNMMSEHKENSRPRGQKIPDTVEAWRNHAYLIGDLVEDQRDAISKLKRDNNKLTQRVARLQAEVGEAKSLICELVESTPSGSFYETQWDRDAKAWLAQQGGDSDERD